MEEKKGRQYTDIGYVIRETGMLIKQSRDKSSAAVEAANITGMQGWMLGYLADRSEKSKETFQRDLEQEFAIRRSTASEMVKLLESNGLIVREAVESDARLKRIVLTPKAYAIHNRVKVELQELEKVMGSGIDKEELNTFFNVINKIKRNLEQK